MNLASRRLSVLVILSYALLAASVRARGQSCQTSSEMGEVARKPIAAAGQRYFDWAAKGDVASMRHPGLSTRLFIS